MDLLGTFSSTGHSTPAFSWTCSALSLLTVIQHQYFCGLAQHFLFYRSFSTSIFVDLLGTFSFTGHSAPVFLWTCSALSLLLVIQHQHFRGLAQHLLSSQSFAIQQLTLFPIKSPTQALPGGVKNKINLYS